MNRSYNYVALEAPKVTLQKETKDKPFAELCEMTGLIPEEARKDLANVKIYDMYLPNFSMRLSEGSYKYDMMMVNSGGVGSEYMGSCLFLEGGVKTYLRGTDTTMETPEGAQNFKYDPQNEFRHKLPKNRQFRLVQFSVMPGFLLNLLPEEETWADKLKNRILRNERILGDRTPAIVRAQTQALQLILNCPLSGKLGQTMIETAIVQIMLLNLHSLFQKEQSQTSSISSKDVKTAKAVKEYIDSTYLADHSLNDLTRHFGTNSNKLMSLFKTVFNKSIFEHIGELKMEHAHDLLVKEDRTVTEVARLVGYKNANHFSTAFKKRFGISPTKVK
ncbi:MAG TPA: AraC family transcriptional regulator [Cyclobacteriaceae bacterium]|nr:AraC family transcriptional regulator [Cyclobacteriaceae bacterium]